jgi:hypothetical protein
MYDYFTGIQSHSGERDEKQKVLRQGRSWLEHERVKILGKNRTKNSQQGYLPASKNGPGQEHGEYVEKTEVDVDKVPPIHESNNRNENGGARQYCARASLQSNKAQKRRGAWHGPSFQARYPE